MIPEILVAAVLLALQVAVMLWPPVAAIAACRKAPSASKAALRLGQLMLVIAAGNLLFGYWIIVDETFHVTPRSPQEIEADMNTPGIVFALLALGLPIFAAPVTVPVSLFLRNHVLKPSQPAKNGA